MIGDRALLLVAMELLILVKLVIAVRAEEKFLAGELCRLINISVPLFAE